MRSRARLWDSKTPQYITEPQQLILAGQTGARFPQRCCEEDKQIYSWSAPAAVQEQQQCREFSESEADGSDQRSWQQTVRSETGLTSTAHHASRHFMWGACESFHYRQPICTFLIWDSDDRTSFLFPSKLFIVWNFKVGVKLNKQHRPASLTSSAPISVQDWSLQCPSSAIWHFKIFLSQNSPSNRNPKLKLKTSLEVLNIICPTQEPTSIGHCHYKKWS